MIKKLFQLSLIFFLLFPLFSKAAQETQIELMTSKNNITVGDSFQLSVNIKNASNEGMNLGGIKIPGIENFQEEGTSQSTKISIINGTSMMESSYTINLKAIKEGQFTLGPISFKIKDKNGNDKTINSKKVSLIVKKNTSIKNVFNKNNIDKNNFNKKSTINYMKSIINLLAFIFLIFLLYILKKKQDTKKVKTSKPQNIEKKIELPSESDELFYEKMKKIILDYISTNLKINVESKTSEEIITQLQKQKHYRYLELKRMLEICDQGKFSDKEADKKELFDLIKIIL